MATFLNTRKAVAALEDLMKHAEEKLILISPYLKLSKDFKELLTYRNSKDKITTVIFGKQELKPDEMKFLESLRFVILKFNEDLHAKCYVNDKKMIITSLNLYEFSMANNKEMGVLVDLDNPNDKELYDAAFEEIQFIEDTSQKFEFNVSAKSEVEMIENKTNIIVEKKKDFLNSKFKSTSALSKIMEIQSKELFEIFERKGWIKKDGKSWLLTPKGEIHGGKIKNGQYGEYVAWPEEIINEI